MSESVDWSRFCQVIREHNNFLLTSHIRPDCDALGSELGMAGLLRSLGKKVRIVNGQATPPNLKFIDPTNSIQAIGIDIQFEQLQDVEVLMVLDTSAWAQLGPMGDVLRQTKAKKIVLDHHVSADDLGAEMFKDTSAEASGRLVYEAAEQLGVKITAEIAIPLYAAIATDTGWFRFASTKPSTYEVIARLVEAGAVPAKIYQQLYEQDTLARLKLIGRTLSKAQTELNGRMIHTAVLQEDFQATGALPSDTEDVVNMTLAVGGVEVALIMVEQPKGGFKVSFRSRSEVSCSKLAEGFGGGGHKAAAGAFIEGTLEEARPKLLDAILSAMR